MDVQGVAGVGGEEIFVFFIMRMSRGGASTFLTYSTIREWGKERLVLGIGYFARK